ncbi:hypothetical protein L3X38_035931 [Prunus dulcis]|uniref:Reverse transcriptase domain-containing protein n=1 Tax=Prunus dulcis TaxID=3755 RepID=A0AAD4YYB0_PRUDU|nr:hypothetical protein L3X38_035931 [Prunus dulcis]
MEVYVDDMLFKAPKRADHIGNLAESFSLLHQYCMKLNPSKCTFGVSSGRFLGYLVTQRVPGEDLFLYLAVSNSAISSALIREELGA